MSMPISCRAAAQLSHDYYEGSFYGISDTSEALRNIARMLIEQGADPTLAERTEALIVEEEAKK